MGEGKRRRGGGRHSVRSCNTGPLRTSQGDTSHCSNMWMFSLVLSNITTSHFENILQTLENISDQLHYRSFPGSQTLHYSKWPLSLTVISTPEYGASVIVITC